MKFFFTMLFVGFGVCNACHLSNLTLLSVTPSGSNYIIQVQLCIGHGRTGLASGGADITKSIYFGFYDATAPINILSFTPSITSSFTGCTMLGYDVGPQPTFNSDATIVYYWDFFEPACSNGFLCTSTTALCGNISIDCFTLNFEVDNLPDQMRVFGVEANDNPDSTVGCSPNNDMRINFSPLPVTWGSVSAKSDNGEVFIDWNCLSQMNNDFFTIERYNIESHSWDEIGFVDGAGNSNVPLNYSFSDVYPIGGLSYYRIKQTDFDGRSSSSPMVSIYFENNRFTLFPMPFYDKFTFFTNMNYPVDARIILYNSIGHKVFEMDDRVYKSTIIDAHNLPSGIYFLYYTIGSKTKCERVIKY